MFVIIENGSEDVLSVSDPVLWADLYLQLMQDIIKDPISQQRVLVDILNEPDSHGLSWQTVSSEEISEHWTDWAPRATLI